jgi:hypothetical protein
VTCGLSGRYRRVCFRKGGKPGGKLGFILFRLTLSGLGLALLFSLCTLTVPVTFKLVDEETGQAITNGRVVVFQRWTSLPIEKLHLPGIHPWMKSVTSCVSGSIRVRVPVKPDPAFTISFTAPGNRAAAFSADEYVIYSPQREPLKVCRKSKVIRIVLSGGREELIP